MTLLERVKELCSENKVSQRTVEKECGLSNGSITKWKTSNPSSDTVQKVAEFFNVSTDWLNGTSEMKDRTTKETIEQWNERLGILPISKQRLPLLGEIACGEPIFANEERESYIEAGTNIQADFCLKAKGDSMINARIHDGDIIFIRKQEMVANGDIGAVIIDESATLKRVFYYPDDKKLVLQAENPKYEPLVYIGEELDHVHILGKAVAFQSDVI
ncbi:MAG: XRE family transcriptional regulator [Candidatus Cloacimonetes bacterium]|jgi:repressor LexA|nr:XRE family transcriptional regulator [Candidatus Cloacimonadota bacterium]